MQLDEVIPWGRSLDEYVRMFALTPLDLQRRILGCGDGPASFNAEATETGAAVTSCDPIYAFSGVEIERRVFACYDSVVGQVKEQADGFVWDYFADPDDLGRARLDAMRRFLQDYETGQTQGRYVVGSLPTLPFRTGEFSLALCSHLLFLYSDRFSEAWHLAALEELLRVADEVRVFPLVTLTREVSPYVEGVCAALRRAGLEATIEETAYEFQKAPDHAGNRLLRVRRPRA